MQRKEELEGGEDWPDETIVDGIAMDAPLFLSLLILLSETYKSQSCVVCPGTRKSVDEEPLVAHHERQEGSNETASLCF
jgi:hypothetical protein